MRHYECMYIADPALSEEDLGSLAERFRQVVLNQGGAVETMEKWERRRLAFEVKGKREGVYYLMNFTANPGAEAELGRVLGLTEGVLRHMVIRLDDKALKYMAQQAALRAKQQAAAAASQAAAAAAQAAAQAAAPPTPAPTPTPDRADEQEAAPPAEPEATEEPTTEPVTDEATTEEVTASEDEDTTER